jgi:hypothetical protein
MFDLDVRYSRKDIKRLEKACKRFGKRFPTKMKTLTNRGARTAVKIAKKEIRKEVNITAKNLNKVMAKKGGLAKVVYLSDPASVRNLRATVTVSHTHRAPLKYFGARHVKKGVSYKILKKGKRELRLSAFMGGKPGVKAPKLHGHAFIRKGKQRKPIAKLRAVSVLYLFKKLNLLPRVKKAVRAELPKLIDKEVIKLFNNSLKEKK